MEEVNQPSKFQEKVAWQKKAALEMLVARTRMFYNVRRVSGWLKFVSLTVALEILLCRTSFISITGYQQKGWKRQQCRGFGGVWKDLNANLSKIDHHGFKPSIYPKFVVKRLCKCAQLAFSGRTFVLPATFPETLLGFSSKMRPICKRI